jgi:hypothetical protein
MRLPKGFGEARGKRVFGWPAYPHTTNENRKGNFKWDAKSRPQCPLCAQVGHSFADTRSRIADIAPAMALASRLASALLSGKGIAAGGYQQTEHVEGRIGLPDVQRTVGQTSSLNSPNAVVRSEVSVCHEPRYS